MVERITMNRAILNVSGYVHRDLVVRYIISSIYLELLENRGAKYYEELYEFATKTKQKVVFNDKLNVFEEFIHNANDEELYELIKYSLNNIRVTYDDSSREELCNLVIKLFGPLNKKSIIYDATMGQGTFLFNILEYLETNNVNVEALLGADNNENNILTARILFLLISFLKGTKNKVQVKCIDAMNESVEEETKFIYLYPPFGLRILNTFDNEETKLFKDIKWNTKITPEWIFVDNVLSKSKSSLNKLIAIITKRALFSEADKEYRNALIENGYLESIIELPSTSLKNISLQPVLLIFSQGNKKIKYVNASECVKQNKYLPFMDVDKVLNKYTNEFNEISISEATQTENLCPSILEIKDAPIPNSKTLKEVADVFVGTQYTSRNFKDDIVDYPTGYQLLTSKDLESGEIDYENLMNVNSSLEKFNKYAIRKGDTIIPSKTSKLNIVLVNEEPPSKIIVTGGMLVIRPNKEIINPVYLKIYLTSSNGKNALRKIQKGTVVMTISPKELGNILVPSLDLNKQNLIAEEYESILKKINYHKEMINELNNSLNELIEKEDVIR